jgi:hypothetical protein
MTLIINSEEKTTLQKSLLRAKRHTPNLPAADERAMDGLLDKLLEADRQPGDFADDGYGPNELGGLCR